MVGAQKPWRKSAAVCKSSGRRISFQQDSDPVHTAKHLNLTTLELLKTIMYNVPNPTPVQHQNHDMETNIQRYNTVSLMEIKSFCQELLEPTEMQSFYANGGFFRCCGECLCNQVLSVLHLFQHEVEISATRLPQSAKFIRTIIFKCSMETTIH